MKTFSKDTHDFEVGFDAKEAVPVSTSRGKQSSLDALAFGVPARVVAVEGSGPVARRLMEMGVVPGAPVCVIKAAPLGDPLEVRVRGYHLAMRRSEAQTVKVLAGE